MLGKCAHNCARQGLHFLISIWVGVGLRACDTRMLSQIKTIAKKSQIVTHPHRRKNLIKARAL